jgi:phage-related protein
MKKLIWIGGSKRRVKEFPDEARQKAGHELWQVQEGFDPDDWRPMLTVGAGAKEIRLHKPHEHRVIYVAQFTEGIYVLHAFEKKTRQTPQREIDTARSSYAEMQKQRNERG